MSKETRFTIRITDELHQWLKRYALYEGVTMTGIVVGYLESLRQKEGDVILAKKKAGDLQQSAGGSA